MGSVPVTPQETAAPFTFITAHLEHPPPSLCPYHPAAHRLFPGLIQACRSLEEEEEGGGGTWMSDVPAGMKGKEGRVKELRKTRVP